MEGPRCHTEDRNFSLDVMEGSGARERIHQWHRGLRMGAREDEQLGGSAITQARGDEGLGEARGGEDRKEEMGARVLQRQTQRNMEGQRAMLITKMIKIG